MNFLGLRVFVVNLSLELSYAVHHGFLVGIEGSAKLLSTIALRMSLNTLSLQFL